MAASASARVPETVQPAAAAWPPPPSRAHTLVALSPPLVRTDSLQPPSASSRMVTEVSTPLNLSQEGGDILHILLSCVRLVHEGQGHGGHSDFPVLIAVHPLGEQPLHLKPRPALGAEVALIEREHVHAGFHQGGGYPVGVRRGVAVLKAAGIGGHGYRGAPPWRG